MRRDKARQFTEKELKRIESELNRIYVKSSAKVGQPFRDYMRRVNKETASAVNLYNKALQNGSRRDREVARSILEKALYDETLGNKKYRKTVALVTNRMAEVNVAALAYITSKMPEIYAVNYNAIAPKAIKLGVDWTIINKNTVQNLAKEKKIQTPSKILNIPKDKRWNAKKINSEVLQGIKNGESADKIAKRIFPHINAKTNYAGLSKEERRALIRKNEQSAMRNARTMVTQAENLGRLDSYFELQNKGVVTQKQWLAVGDDRTRDSHLSIDGETVNLDEKFSNDLMYPGDPAGDPDEVWECRCSMEEVIIGFFGDNGYSNLVDRSLHEDTGHSKSVQDEIRRREQKRRK